MLLVQEVLGFLIQKIDNHLRIKLNKKDSHEAAEKGLIEGLLVRGTSLDFDKPAAGDLPIASLKLTDDPSWLTLPTEELLKKSDSKLYQLTPEALKKEGDACPLRTGETWGKMMLSSWEEFDKYLDNNFLKENLPDKKMIILARFKRQLILLAEYAKRVLSAREKHQLAQAQLTLVAPKAALPAPGANKKEKAKNPAPNLPSNSESAPVSGIKAPEENPKEIPFTDSVDEWLVKMVMACSKEANVLLSKALESAKISINLPSFLPFSLPKVSIEHSPRETEMLIYNCEQTLATFMQIAKEKSKGMLDIFPSQMEATTKTTIYKTLAQYLIENIWDEISYEAYKHFDLWSPLASYVYDKKLAQTKRDHVLGSLKRMESLVSTLEKPKSLVSTPENPKWGELLDSIDQAFKEAKSFTPAGSRHMQRLPVTWQKLHQSIMEKAPSPFDSEIVRHRKCHFS